MAEQFCLGEQPIVAFVAARNAIAAKAFYGQQLGLRLVSEELPFALVFDAHGVLLRVVIVNEFTPAPYTVLGWRVSDIALAVNALQEAGLKFERYSHMDQDELGIWTSPGGARIARFKDHDGNTLSISEH